jgi:ferric-dicitrate binding protein FerR (iron transport regulator)
LDLQIDALSHFATAWASSALQLEGLDDSVECSFEDTHLLRGGPRDIELLSGQALFDVAKDPGRPFVVRSGGTEVRAVGTQFDVYKKHHGVVVTVIEGRVSFGVISRKAAEFALHPSDAAKSHNQNDLRRRILSAGEQATVMAADVQKNENVDVSGAVRGPDELYF